MSSSWRASIWLSLLCLFAVGSCMEIPPSTPAPAPPGNRTNAWRYSDPCPGLAAQQCRTRCSGAADERCACYPGETALGAGTTTVTCAVVHTGGACDKNSDCPDDHLPTATRAPQHCYTSSCHLGCTDNATCGGIASNTYCWYENAGLLGMCAYNNAGQPPAPAPKNKGHYGDPCLGLDSAWCFTACEGPPDTQCQCRSDEIAAGPGMKNAHCLLVGCESGCDRPHTFAPLTNHTQLVTHSSLRAEHNQFIIYNKTGGLGGGVGPPPAGSMVSS